MWPKTLLELLPHFARLLPVADKYLASRSANDQTQAALTQEVRGQLGAVSEAQAELSRQLQRQGEQIAEIGVDAARARIGMESVEQRVAKLEKSLRLVVTLLVLTFVLAAATLALVAIRMVR